MTDIPTMVGELAAKRALIADLKAEEKELEYQLVGHLRQRYPQEWSDWERGIRSFKADGVEVPVSRTYDINKFRAEFGEERPGDIVEEYEETKIVPARVDARKVMKLWSDASYATRLSKTIVPPAVKIRLT